jgi:hypothetical protein
VLPRFTAITQYKQDLDIEPLNIAAFMREQVQLCKKMNCKLMRTLITIPHKTSYTYETVIESLIELLRDLVPWTYSFRMKSA